MINKNDRFWSNILKEKNKCWTWRLKLNEDGYGNFRKTKAHRYAYEVFVGKIGHGLEIDHLCKNRACVNPEHLEAVTHQENVKRGNYKNNGKELARIHLNKTHCLRGHPYSGDNLRIEKRADGGTRRRCKICDRIKQNNYIKRKIMW